MTGGNGNEGLNGHEIGEEGARGPMRLTTDRRSFLKWAGGATGALLPAGTAAQAAAPMTATGALYRETEHIRRYYELAR